jgi:hypothetical protein
MLLDWAAKGKGQACRHGDRQGGLGPCVHGLLTPTHCRAYVLAEAPGLFAQLASCIKQAGVGAVIVVKPQFHHQRGAASRLKVPRLQGPEHCGAALRRSGSLQGEAGRCATCLRPGEQASALEKCGAEVGGSRNWLSETAMPQLS